MIKIALLAHVMPDYDAICSVTALYKFIKRNYDEVEVYPIVEPNQLKNIDNPIKYYLLNDVQNLQFDYVIVCDVNDVKRCYGINILNGVKHENRFLIDHHDSNQQELDIQNKLVLGEMSSTCQILYRLFLKQINKIDKDILKNLFMGIASDTSSFTNSKKDIGLQDTDKFDLTAGEKEIILANVNELNNQQQLLLSQIKPLGNIIDGILFYELEINENDNVVMPLLKHPAFYEKTFYTIDNPVSIFIIKTRTRITIKFRKSLDCNFDIITLAYFFNGGGHNDRCNGYLNVSSIEEALNLIIKKINKSKVLRI